MRFDPVDDEHAISLSSVAVEISRDTICQATQLDHLHRSPDWTANRLLGHTQLGQHSYLPAGGRATVATHCWHHKRRCTSGLEVAHDRSQRWHNIVDTTATSS